MLSVKECECCISTVCSTLSVVSSNNCSAAGIHSGAACWRSQGGSSRKAHVHFLHIQLQDSGRLAAAKQASQVGLGAALVTVHKLLQDPPD